MEIGTKFYRENKKTKEIDELTIVDVQYIFNKKIGSRNNYTESEINSLIKDNIITDDVNILKNEAIKKIEEQFGIKLKEI